MKNHILNIILTVSAFALLFYLLSLQHTTQSLKADMGRLEKTSPPSMPEKEEDDDNDKPASKKDASHPSASSSNQRESPDVNEVKRILEQSKHDLATQKAFVGKYGTAMQSVYIYTSKDCAFYWRQIKFQTDMARQSIFGGITLLVGVLSFFLFPKDNIQANKENNYFANVFYGFRPSVIKENPVLYITLAAFMVFNIGLQVFMPYFIVYVQDILLIQGDAFTISLGVVLLGASTITVVFGLFMDKIGKNRIMIPGLIVGAIGGAIIFFVPTGESFTQPGLIIGGIVLMTGYLVSTAVLGAKVRDYTPVKEVGLFQGVRMIFVVLIPMIIGPLIGDGLCKSMGKAYINKLGATVYPPNKWLFLVTGIIFLCAIVPVILMIRKEKKLNESTTAE